MINTVIEIISSVLAVFLLVVTSPFLLLNDVTIGVQIPQGFEEISALISSLNDIFPVSVVIAIIAFDLVFEGSVFAYKGIRWAYQKLPFVN